ncbi:MAG: carboxymuconolactone decarboxylase family protein [Thermoleophilia bacterium]
MAGVDEEAGRSLRRLASGRPDAVADVLHMDPDGEGVTSLARSTAGLVSLAAVIAVDGPPAELRAQVDAALRAGADAEDIVSVLVAVAPHVGASRIVSAAPAILRALEEGPAGR